MTREVAKSSPGSRRTRSAVKSTERVVTRTFRGLLGHPGDAVTMAVGTKVRPLTVLDGSGHQPQLLAPLQAKRRNS